MQETLYTANRARQLFERLTGLRPSPDTVHRWCAKGVRGVVLGSRWIGGQRYLTEADVRDFLARLNQARPEPEAARPRGRRRAAASQARRLLRDAGLPAQPQPAG